MDKPFTLYDFAPGETVVTTSYNLNDKPTFSLGFVGDPIPESNADVTIIVKSASTLTTKF